MSEPGTRAESWSDLAPGIRHWTLHDDRIDFRSEAYAVETGQGWILLDPLPLADAALDRLGPLATVYLTGGFHQRSAWSLRARLGLAVHAPAGASGLEEEPDAWFEDGHEAAEGLVALDRPGPTRPHFVFRLTRDKGPSALFCADLAIREADGPFRFVADEHHDDPALARDSLRRLLDPAVDLLCPAHGAPALRDGTREMRRVLERDARP